MIGYLGGASPGPFAPFVAAFRQGLRETGYVEGQNLAIEYRWAVRRQVRNRLPAGGNRIRTIGPPLEERPFRRALPRRLALGGDVRLGDGLRSHRVSLRASVFRLRRCLDETDNHAHQLPALAGSQSNAQRR